MVLAVDGLLNADQECWLRNVDLLDDWADELVVNFEQVEEHVFPPDNTLMVEEDCLMMRMIVRW